MNAWTGEQQISLFLKTNKQTNKQINKKAKTDSSVRQHLQCAWGEVRTLVDNLGT